MQNTTTNVLDHRALCRVKAVPQWWLDAGRFVREFPQLFRANYDLFVKNCPEIINHKVQNVELGSLTNSKKTDQVT